MNTYIHVINDEGERLTSIVIDILTSKEKALERAKEMFPDAIYLEGDDEMLNAFMEGKIYKDGNLVDPDPIIPTPLERKEQEILELNNEFATAEAKSLEALRKALLAGDSALIESIQEDYKLIQESYIEELSQLKLDLIALKG